MTPRQSLQDIVDLLQRQIQEGKINVDPVTQDGRALAAALQAGVSALKSSDIQVIPDPKLVALVHEMDQRPIERWSMPEIKTLHSFALLASSAAALSKGEHLIVDAEMSAKPAAAQELIDMVQDMSARPVHSWETAEIRAVHGLASLMVAAATLNSQNALQIEPSSGLDVETLIAAATKHGEESEPDHEVGDLQEYIRSAWAVLTEAQKTAVFLLPSVQATYENAVDEQLSLAPAEGKRKTPRP